MIVFYKLIKGKYDRLELSITAIELCTAMYYFLIPKSCNISCCL
nr:MAG TPA: hypothetical protein [Crassvirales sp.]